MPPRKLGYRDLKGLLHKKPLPRFWALLGPAADLKVEARDRIRATLARTHPDTFERVLADASEEPLENLPVSYLVGSLFSQTKLVDIRGLEGHSPSARKAFLKSLDPGKLHPSLHIILTTDERENTIPDAFTKLTFWPFRTREEILGWIADTARELKVKLEPGVAELFHERFGFDTQNIRRELEKAGLYAQGRAVTPADLIDHTEEARESDVFEVLAEILSGRASKAMPGMARLWDQNEAPVKILSILLAQMRRVMTVAALTEAHHGCLDSAFELARQHERTDNFWNQKKLEKQILPQVKAEVPDEVFQTHFASMKPLPLLNILTLAKLYDGQQAWSVYRHLIHLDREVKSSGTEPEIGLERAAMEIQRILVS